ncbi:MAG: toprim domain-containing protein, partial [Caldilineaceae bacterium]
AAGLIKRRTEQEGTYDAFRSRVVFPIRDRQGRVLGFGGRVLDDSVPKYLNTSDTPVFHKSQIIYGIDLAHQAIRSENRVVIVEGYMDVIAAHQFGFSNVVACMGTALTADHLRQLQRLTNHYVLALDADAAGNAATMRGLHQARLSLERRSLPTVMPGGRLEMTDRLGATITIVQVPNGKDPDDFIRSAPDRWPTLVAEGQPLVDYYFGLVVSTFDLKTAAGRGAAVEELAGLIGELEDEVQQAYYIQQLSSRVQVAENILYGQVRAAARRSREDGHRNRPPSSSGAGPGHFGNRTGSRTRPRGQTLPGAPNARAGRPDEPLPSDALPPASGWDDTFDGYDPGEDAGSGSPWNDGVDTGLYPVGGRAAGGVATSVGQHFDVADHILALLLRAPDLLPYIAQKAEEINIDPPSDEDMVRTEDKELFRALRLFLTSDEPWNLESFQETLDQPLYGRLASLAIFGNDLPPRNDQELREGVIKDIVNLRLQRVKMECETVKSLIAEAVRNVDGDLARELGSVYGRLQRDLAHLQPLKHREFHKATASKGHSTNSGH